MSKLVLGCAQFGLPYGVTRVQDHVDDVELAAILDHAASAGVRMLDLSPAYGNAEARLGRQDLARFCVQTKTRGGVAALTGADVQRDFQGSCQAVSRAFVESLLVHDPATLEGPHGRGVLDAMRSLKAQGRVGRIGVSVYDRLQLERVMKLFAPDVVQVPVSVADQRLVHDGTLEELAQRGVTVQVRSIFLQGLLLAPDVPLPARLEPVAGLLRRLPWSGGDVLEAARHCFGYIASLAFVDEIVFGVHSSTQLSTLLSAYENPARAVVWAECALPDAYVDPRTW